MAGGLFALLDDVAAIAKVAAATLDDVAAQSLKAGGKAAGIVIDDTAVTPRYVVGFAAARELPIVWRIALGSLKNKLLFLLPGALLLSAVAPWVITPLLMLGGVYLCFEGAEKLHHMLFGHDPVVEEAGAAVDPATLEAEKVAGAIRTDLVLSAEIMAIALATIEVPDFMTRALVLALVGVSITIGVYGFVALLVKADDIGAAMARGRVALLRAIGRGLVLGMPGLLAVLSVVGTLAMLWVGGGILVHGLAVFGLHAPEYLIEDLAQWIADRAGPVAGAAHWLVAAIGAGILGMAVGWLVIALWQLVRPSARH